MTKKKAVPDTRGPEIPVNTVVGKMSQTSGQELEVTTRLNDKLARAVAMGHLFGSPISFGSSWVTSRTDQLMRLAISMSGEGRKDLIEALRAAGTIPEAAFGPKSSEFYPMDERWRPSSTIGTSNGR